MFNLKNPVVKGSLILVFLIGIFNALNLLYQILMARSLSLVDYGLLKRTFVFLYIGGILMESLQTIIAKYSSENTRPGKLKGILRLTAGKLIPYSFLIFLVFALLSLAFARFFNIPYPLLAFAGLFFIGSMLAPLTRGILQAQQRFTALGLSVLSEGVLKVLLAFLFVMLGWGVYGAVGGVIAGIFLSFFFSFIFFRKILNSKEIPASLPGIKVYSLPVLFVTASLIAFFNIDVLLSGTFFSAEAAGIYAVASTIGTIIFVGTQPIAKVLFPITANNRLKPGRAKHHAKKAFLLVLFAGIIALLIFLFFPEFLLKLFVGMQLPEAVPILLILGMGSLILSLAGIILYYKLSQGRTSGYQFLPLFLIIEAVLLASSGFLFSSLFTFSLAYLLATIIFLIGSLILLQR